jgi:hypothetical protein
MESITLKIPFWGLTGVNERYCLIMTVTVVRRRLAFPASSIYLMSGKIRSWLNDHPVASLALWFAGLLFTFALVQILYRTITGNWCP